MGKFFDRSMEIIKGGIIESTSDYTANLRSLKNDADSIRTSVMEEGKTAKEAYTKMKSKNLHKTLLEWFYTKGEENESYGDLDFGNDDFDAGFGDIDDSTDEPDTAPAINVESMKGIARGQVGAMYNIAGKQTEASMANTAEIVSTFNTRSSEIIASINKIESSLNSISQKMDTLIKVVSTPVTKPREYGDKDSVYDTDGMLSPLAVYNNLKRGIKENSLIGSGLGFVQTGLSMGGFTPEALLSMGLSKIYEKQRFSFLGNKTIDEVGNQFNDTVKSITHNVLAEFLDSKPLNFILDTIGLENPMYGYGERDYSRIRKNEFNNKPAVFDGLVRHSIIHTIPDYLKNIHNALTGKNLVVDQKGNLTDNPTDKFSQVTRKAFADSGLDYGVDFAIANEARAGMPDINSSDVNEAGKVLTMIYVMYLYQSGNTMLKTSQISSTDVNVINRAVKTLMAASGKSQEYWSNVCLLILHRLEKNMNEATKFASNVNVRLRAMDEEAEKLASSGSFFGDIGKLSYNMAEEEYISNRKNKQNSYDEDANNEAKTGSSGVGNGSKNYSNFTMLDYTRGIFNVLKRGINVKITSKPNDYSGYKPFKLNHVESVADVQDQVDAVVDKININRGDGLTYMERMLEAIAPKSAFRLAGMQHFAKRRDDENTGDKDGEQPSIWDDYSDTKSGKVANFADKAISKVKGVGKQIFGERVAEVGPDGKTRYHREGGAINNVAGFVYGKAAGIGGNIVDKIKENIEYHRAKDILEDTKSKLNKMQPTNDTEKEDQQKAQMVLSMMNASAVDGDTEADLSDISNIIQQISDPKLKARLQASVMPLLRRSGKKKDGGGLVGKIFGLGFAAVKLILTPLLKTIGAAVMGLKAVGTGLVHATQRYVKNSVIDLRVGMSNIFRSMFGRKMKTDSSGNVIQESEEGLIQIIFKKHFDKLNKGFKSFSNKLSGILNSATKGLNTVRNKLSTGMDKLFKKVGEMGNSAMSWVSNKYFDSKMKKTEAKDLSGRNEFMKGFLGVFEESKKAKREALLKSKKPETYADVKAGKIHEEVSEVSNTIKENKSILSQIRDKLDAIINKGNKPNNDTGAEAKIPDKKTREAEINKSVEAYYGVKQKLDMGNMLMGDNEGPSLSTSVSGGAAAPVSFGVANAKGTNPANVVPNTIQQTPLQTNVQPVVTNIGSGSDAENQSGSAKAGSKVGKALGAIGKGVGGMVSIGKFILKILGPALASMGGLNSLMNTVSKTLKTIAKPVNSIFKDLNKTMKPLFKKMAPMLQNILSIVGGLVSDLMPVVTTLAGATMGLLPALTPVIKAITTVLTPVIQGLNGLLETVVVPAIQVVAGAVTGLLGGILWLGGTFATAIGKLIPGKTGDKVEQTGIGVKKAGTDTLKEAGNLFKSAFSTIVNKVNAIMSGDESISSDENGDENKATADTNKDGKVNEKDVAKYVEENYSIEAKTKFKSSNEQYKDIEKDQEFIRAYGASVGNEDLANYKHNKWFTNPLEEKTLTEATLRYIATQDGSSSSTFKSEEEIIVDAMTEKMDGIEKSVQESVNVNKSIYAEAEKQNKRVNKYMDFDEDATKKGSLPFIAKLSVGLLPAISKVSGTNSGIMGAIMIAGGAILSALGLLPGAGDFSNTGNQLYTEGKNKLVESATAGDFTKTNIPSLPKTKVDLTEYANRQTGRYAEYTSDKLNVVSYDGNLSNQTSVLDNQGIYYYGSYDELLGSGDVSQKSFGTFMNMSKRGCGPVALAEAYARRTGSRVNPAQLAKGMARTGAYSPDAGTSVQGFINTGGHMGMGMHAAGVTESSLRSASPNNPITVFGSGPAYGTHKGNNHFMNVIGSDGIGNGYVSNPLTGKTSKRSLMSIVRNSKLGLYGSGDENIENATSQIADVKSAMNLDNIADIDSVIGDDTKTAFADLRDLANKILDIFKMDDGDASNILDAETSKAQYEQNLSVLSDEDRAKIEEVAYEIFKSENPQIAGDPGETDEEYEQRWLRNKDKYMLIASNKKASEYFSNRAAEAEALTNNLSGSYSSSLISGGVYSGSGGTISSKTGAKLGTPYKVTITTPNVKPGGVPGQTTETPLHEFFKNTAETTAAWSVDRNWFKQRHSPNRYGVGSSGAAHKGLDILVTGGETNTKPMIATTDGIVTEAVGGIYRDGVTTDGDGFGNHVKWRDVAGNIHIYAHMHNPNPTVKKGDEIIGGKTLMGFMGNTGWSDGHHLHYEIRDKSYNPLNPIEYFSIYTPPTNSSSSNLGNGSDEDKIFRYLISNGANKIAASGFMGVWEHESDNNPSRLEGDYNMGGVNSTRVMNAFKSQAAMNQYTKDMVQKVYGGWGTLSHSTYCPDGTNYYPGVGLAQWTGTRTQSLARKAKEQGTQWNNLGTQLALWKDEVNGNWSSSLSGANKAGSPGAAAEVVLNRFEGLSSNNKYAYLSTRQRFANEFYNRYKNMDPSQDLIDATNASNLAAITENSNGTFTVKQGNTTLVSREGYSQEHLQDLMGSGDEYTLDDLLNTNRFNDTFDTSLIDTSIPESNGNNQPIIVNRYITHDEGKNDERLKMILSNTYNVRAKRVEELLEEIIEKMDDNDKPKPTGGSGTRNTTPSNMFDENGIPKALQRLYTE